MANYGDFQLELYFAGLSADARRSRHPPAGGARARGDGPEVWSYVAGGAGNELTQDST